MLEKSKPRTVKLLCPSLSKLVTLVAWEEQKLDLGSIASAFGLDPSTVKVNGHFISRGVDLVSASVTWRSLLSFFSTRGLSTGKDDKDALIVDGKLCKVGTKRAHDSQDAVNGICDKFESKDIGICRRSLPEDINLNKRLRGSNSVQNILDDEAWQFIPLPMYFYGENLSVSGCSVQLTLSCGSSECEEGDHPASKWNDLGSKRKHLFEDLQLLKKLRINETEPDFQGRRNNNPLAPLQKTDLLSVTYVRI